MPAYNEEENIEIATLEIYEFLKKNFKKFEVIIVDDGSSDKTGKIADRLSKKYKDIKVIHHPKNLKYGMALKSGFENAKYDLIFYTDADRQFNISELKKFMHYIKKYEVVVGYRKKRKDPFMRIVYSKLFNFALRFLLGLNFKDADCAFKLCKREVVDKIKPLTQKEGGVDAELLTKSKAYGFKIKEITVTHFPRKAGVSKAISSSRGFFVKIKPKTIIALIKEILDLRKSLNFFTQE